MAQTRTATFLNGEQIFEEGDPAETIYLVKSGHVTVYRRDDEGNRIDLSDVGPGEVLGTFSLLNGQKRTASAVALGNVQAEAIDTTLMAETLKGGIPYWLGVVIRDMSSRFAALEKKYMESERETHRLKAQVVRLQKQIP